MMWLKVIIEYFDVVLVKGIVCLSQLVKQMYYYCFIYEFLFIFFKDGKFVMDVIEELVFIEDDCDERRVELSINFMQFLVLLVFRLKY